MTEENLYKQKFLFWDHYLTPSPLDMNINTGFDIADMNNFHHTYFQTQQPLTYTVSSIPVDTSVSRPSSEDSGYLVKKQSYALRKDEPIVRLWNCSIRAFIRNLIKAACWNAIDVFRRGYSFDSCSTTILITVPSLGDHECPQFQTIRNASLDQFWVTMALKVFYECRQQGVDINIELIEGETQKFDMTQSDGMCSMGDSIGVQGELETGTLGGFMSIEGRESPVFALTCHHVLSRSMTPLGKTFVLYVFALYQLLT